MTTDAREPLTDLYGRHRKFWDNEWCWCCMEHTPCSDSLFEELALALAEVRRLRLENHRLRERYVVGLDALIPSEQLLED